MNLMRVSNLIHNKKKIFIFILKNPIFFFKKILDLVIRIIIFPITIIIFFIIIFTSIFLLIRIGKFRSDKIGHLSLEYEIYLIEKKLGINFKKKCIDFWFKNKLVCNQYLFDIRKKQLNLVSNIIFRELYFLFKMFKLGDYFICERKYSDSDINYVLDKSSSTVNLNKSIITSNLNKLYDCGLSRNQKIILLHLRDTAYRGYSDMTDYKNIHNIKPYFKTVNYLIKKGYFVIRTGRKANIKFNINNKNFLDYPFSSIKSDEMDLAIASICYFCISSGSGFDGIVRVFRNPVLFTNFLPIGYFNSFGKKNMTIFKHHINKKNNKKLSVKHLLKFNLINTLDGNSFKKNNIFFKENTSNEILEATKEMLEFIKNNFKKKHTQKNKNINKFFKEEIKKKYLYSMHKKINSVIPINFLKKNKYLFNI